MRGRCVGRKRDIHALFTGYYRNGCSVRLRALRSLMWAFGMLHRLVDFVLTALGCPAPRMSGWRAM